MYAKGMKLPKGKKCAAFLTVDLSAEFFWIALDKKAVDMPKTLSLGQYGMTHGLPRILELLDQFGIKATFFVPGKTAETYPEAIKEVVNRGHEIACHGYEYENFSLLDYDEQEIRIRKAVQAIEAACGKKPEGFRAPIGDLMLETLDIARKYGMKYSSDLFDDDRPYFMEVNQEGDKILQIPMQWAILICRILRLITDRHFRLARAEWQTTAMSFPIGKMSLQDITIMDCVIPFSWILRQPGALGELPL